MPLYKPAVAPAFIVPPASITNAAAAAWPAVNRALFSRFTLTLPGIYRYLNWVVGTQSGNVQVGVVSLSGALRTSYSRVMNSTVIACPAAADIRTDLGATLLPPGDYAAFLWADNTTFQARTTNGAGQTGLRVAGQESSLASGVGTSGTITWSTQSATVSLEGDLA